MVSQELHHPYFPRSLKLPNYVPNTLTAPEILTIFGGAVALVGTLAFFAASRGRHSVTCRLAITWFVICGCIHLVLEGYFAIFYNVIIADNHFLSQVWKEYGKADSRYLIADTFTVTMESLTAFIEGPACVWVAVAHARRGRERHALQLLVSAWQLYGTVLYFATEAFDGWPHAHAGGRESVYFWTYLVAINAVWLLVPSLLIAQAWRRLCDAQCDHDARSDGWKKQ
ncbi:PREDICTED: 3-beta-hydroxysteroid-Delta(8),Delta(7)-isomerase-like [Priapulus caudatus]|uniref:3-beta-hydroxysteroid-Delta(8), Delta(7)-isomerase-like n=1 Tax=Priapulus caudatus TaxID=37621 RepID=A0ABM1EXK2_PRICU|nr:PREDICTED: 3-beta-hydroxysteroid-Delta(8),Delta(7)-isomerase-like [Priapulus caudatus]XP_014676918.1 PREDICTED: 3-beta-hydroxysteroid-Delta(8),Delta(7)-isomerase-like [Priapulus caudatus]XP_014676919.1 PREDICTED: 3-beta-hydroxysteroid-Delta(8),Delta(7)-isomerase-like [Priapulus caudatus]XP_014676920.1 PREDICTED: 3-beta-hydroxysteroid-Delta(8),Delta(7)-isomerase-like [Priapulus caudatus]XP_014676921.1 PREDICTED: 3-beta-hydroxysteroid-Delta(8),Delta(7)-isomerase-like [Priapulus caudatus]XP_01